MYVLATLGDERGTRAIAKRLGQGEDHQAIFALQKMGPKAEIVVAEQLTSSNQRARAAACMVLMNIGTKQSIPLIEAAIRNDPSIRQDGEAAINAIQARVRGY